MKGIWEQMDEKPKILTPEEKQRMWNEFLEDCENPGPPKPFIITIGENGFKLWEEEMQKLIDKKYESGKE